MLQAGHSSVIRVYLVVRSFGGGVLCRMVRKLGLFVAGSWAFVAMMPAVHAGDVDTQLWGTVAVGTEVADSATFTLEAHARWTDDVDRIGVHMIRPSLTWVLHPGYSATVGYIWGHFNPETGVETDEHRLVQQLGVRLSKEAAPVTFESRTRLEQRWLDQDGEVGLRLRQQFRLTVPFSDRMKGVAWTEPFVALDSTRWGQRSGLDRWRNFVGLRFPLGRTQSVEAGYLNQYVVRDGEDSVHHVMSVTLSARM